MRKGFVLLHFLLVVAFAQAQLPYNEVYDSTGRVRPHYAEIIPIIEAMKAEEKKAFLQESLKDFSGDNALLYLPRLITENEQELLRSGVEQRARALRAFLQDHYSKKTYLNKVIPKAAIERIVKRSGEDIFEGRVNPSTISFPYGPDIIRDPQGEWRVLEDNPGFIGGVGDLVQARETLLERSPRLRPFITPQDNPHRYYADLAKYFQKMAREKKGKAVIYQVPPYADNEDYRLIDLFKEQGVETLTPKTKRRLVSTSSGLYIEDLETGVRREKVGYLVINGEHVDIEGSDIDLLSRASEIVALQALEDDERKADVKRQVREALKESKTLNSEEAFELLKKALKAIRYERPSVEDAKKRIPHLIDHIREGRVLTNYSPGVDFIGDKEFTYYVDELIKFYLGEEPILKSIETHKFANFDERGSIILDEKLLKKVMSSQKQYVIKKVDGRGGDSVWVGPKISKKEWEDTAARIKENPELYIVQKYSPLSVLGDHIVDLRAISTVHPDGVIVADTFWGRGINKKGDGKVNLSSKGVEVPIVVVRNPPSRCEKAALKIRLK